MGNLKFKLQGFTQKAVILADASNKSMFLNASPSRLNHLRTLLTGTHVTGDFRKKIGYIDENGEEVKLKSPSLVCVGLISEDAMSAKINGSLNSFSECEEFVQLPREEEVVQEVKKEEI